jgi:hypothetical protein
VLVRHDQRDGRQIARGHRERLVHVARGRRRLGADDRHVGGREERLVRDRLHAREPVLGRVDAGRVARQQDDRGVRLAGGDERRDRVRQPRALRDDADADPPRRPCEAVRRRHRPRLVAGGVVRHLEIVLEVVQDPRVPRAHDAEDVGRALGRQGSRDRLREGHLRRHLGHSLSPSTVAFPDATTLFTQQNL